mmetsp:Transcript_8661/g.15587  ORF Transcript_8661/g.15587 Transcript_8661/m.15587 type:complete len:341 (-) Transcript_8661:182-1204(-)
MSCTTSTQLCQLKPPTALHTSFASQASAVSTCAANCIVERSAIHSWNVLVLKIPSHRIRQENGSSSSGAIEAGSIRQGAAVEVPCIAKPLVTRGVKLLSWSRWFRLIECPGFSTQPLPIAQPNLYPVVITISNHAMPCGCSHKACRDTQTTQRVYVEDRDSGAGGIAKYSGAHGVIDERRLLLLEVDGPLRAKRLPNFLIDDLCNFRQAAGLPSGVLYKLLKRTKHQLSPVFPCFVYAGIGQDIVHPHLLWNRGCPRKFSPHLECTLHSCWQQCTFKCATVDCIPGRQVCDQKGLCSILGALKWFTTVSRPVWPRHRTIAACIHSCHHGHISCHPSIPPS